ncbi:unnamed protein product [Phytophthora fragariaefolia]|uniref:Unnamed protein product n=1 Tax=Phytophthora fragariaefolia TaxID=1490495 RepID=A0A9W6XUH6_9STRA|nr:unnamed protein product [Phytophthora fragariaefolia]
MYLLGSRPFVVFTDHASLHTAIKSPHISQRMARWLSFFAEYNFQVEYKPGRWNVVTDALSRRPDYAVHKTDANAIGVVRTSTPSSSLLDDVRSAYANDADAKQLLDYFAAPSDKSRQKLAKHLRARVHRYRVHNGLLLYSTVDDNADRVVVPNDHELKLRITYEHYDAPTLRHQGREKHICFSRVTSTGLTPVSTHARSARSPINESTVSTPGVDTVNINNQHTQAGPVVNKDAELNAKFSSKAVDFVQRRHAVIRFVQDAIAASVGRQKLNADNNGRGNTNEFKVGSLVYISYSEPS